MHENTKVLLSVSFISLISAAAGKKRLGFRLFFVVPAEKCKSTIALLAISPGNMVSAHLWGWPMLAKIELSQCA